MNKQFIAKQFEVGLNTYNQHAVVQKNIAQQLMLAANELIDEDIRVALEVGAGTGFLTELVLSRLHPQQLVVNDIVGSCSKQIDRLKSIYAGDISFLQGDAEDISFPAVLDAVFSASTVQWFSDLSAFFDKVFLSLKDKGWFVFSTFGPDNFKEIKELCNVGLDYYSKADLCNMLSPYFDVLLAEEWHECLEFEEPLDVLRHIKHTGVNAVSQIFFGKNGLNSFCNGYARLFSTSNNSVLLTYQPIIIVARKK